MKMKNVPNILEKLLLLILPPEDRESLIGDFGEIYDRKRMEQSIFAALYWYILHIIKLIPAFVSDHIYWSIAMLRNYITITVRNLSRHKFYSFLNLFGLSVGIAGFFLVMLFVKDELSYDRFHEGSDRIYRVRVTGLLAGNEFDMSVAAAPMAAALIKDFPEIEQASRIKNMWNKATVRIDDETFVEDNFMFGDSTIFEIFTFPFIKGDPLTALIEPNKVILSETTARKYFNDVDILGKVIEIEGFGNYEVSGVVNDIPHNSHFHFDIIASMSSRRDPQAQIWVSHNYHTYLKLRDDASSTALEAKFPDMMRRYVGPQVQQFLGFSLDDFLQEGGKLGYSLQPLHDIHLHSNLEFELEANSDVKYVYIFSSIGIFLLVIASINYMNLATARSANRSKEVGIRKVVGSGRGNLIYQFIGESIFMCFISIMAAGVIVYLLLPVFNNFSGKELQFFGGNVTVFIFSALIFTLSLGLISGSYPALFLASFHPVNVLKGKLNAGFKSTGFRNTLVVVQFAISIILFSGTLIVSDQLNFINNKKLGYDREHALVISRARSLLGQSAAFINELLKNPFISKVSSMRGVPGEIMGNTIYVPENNTNAEGHLLWRIYVDKEYIPTLNMEMVEGRYFSGVRSADSSSVILNEEAAQFLGYENPVGKQLSVMGTDDIYTIIGVVKDFHQESLREKIRPIVIHSLITTPSNIVVRLNPGNINEATEFIKQTWESFIPGHPFEFYFLEEKFNNLYKTEQITGQIFTVFSILAIFISCLGLLGLAAYSIEQRIKEIGLRKILGASIPNILLKFSKDFVKWVLISNIIAWPTAWFFMNKWLENFAYKTDIDLGIFFISGILAIIVSFLTISYQIVKAARLNPTESLRYE